MMWHTALQKMVPLIFVSLISVIFVILLVVQGKNQPHELHMLNEFEYSADDGSTCLTLPGYKTVDSSPIRSPLAVAEHLIAHARGKVILEVGTRNGDILDCVSHFASKAFAVEINKEYCDQLSQRGLTVICDNFENIGLAEIPTMPQVFFWWPMAASSQNENWLEHARSLTDCATDTQTIAIIAFDNQWQEDVESKVSMRKKYPSSSEYLIPFNEGTSYRTFGSFSVLHFKLCS